MQQDDDAEDDEQEGNTPTDDENADSRHVPARSDFNSCADYVTLSPLSTFIFVQGKLNFTSNAVKLPMKINNIGKKFIKNTVMVYKNRPSVITFAFKITRPSQKRKLQFCII